MKYARASLSFLLCFFAISPIALLAQAALAPAEIGGKAVYVAFPVSIAIDGNLDDWKGVPIQTVDRGPSVSKDPAEDGSFRFAVAADAENFYVLMLARDKNIITGAHKADTWNEDSMEFYLNLSGDLNAKKFGRDIMQYRLAPSPMDNADLAALNVSGNNFSQYPLRAKIFKTEDGWGFEGAVAIGARIPPAHGKEIGFQAQLNGASSKDRNVKLIWSLADTSDNSWQNPSLFGRALYFKIGSADIPMPSAAAKPAPKVAPPPAAPLLSMNQVGYFPTSRKIGSYAGFSSESLPWTLADAATKKIVASGSTTAGSFDAFSEDNLRVADFSSFTKPGDYFLSIGDIQGPVFRIGDDVMKRLSVDSLMYFYRSRSGIELKPEYAGAAWARAAGHLSDAKVPVFDGTDAQGKKWGGYDFFVDGSRGWYDAGDYGKYVVNGGISVWTLQNAYERNPGRYADGQMTIPESGNSYPDILDEARWELEFMLNMQIPEGNPLAGLCFLKLHDRKWAPMPSDLPTEFDNNLERKGGSETGRFAYEPSTAAALNLAASAAQASRLWAPFDKAFSDRCLAAARKAWKAAGDHPDLIAANVPGDGGGNYLDDELSDEFYWAAAELFATTGDAEYLRFLKASPYWKRFPGLEPGKANAMGWGDTAALGDITLVSAPSKLDKADRAAKADRIAATADRYLEDAARGGYGIPMDRAGYVWGSNGGLLNNAIILAIAYDSTKKAAYRDGVTRVMDYLLGYNPLDKSFITGYGINPVSHPHHRLWANDPAAGYAAPPPGVVAGGPDESIEDPEMVSARLAATAIPKRYLDVIGSFATNEVAINWNAPLAWVSNWLDIQYGKR